jgi:hypothetical protein
MGSGPAALSQTPPCLTPGFEIRETKRNGAQSAGRGWSGLRASGIERGKQFRSTFDERHHRVTRDLAEPAYQRLLGVIECAAMDVRDSDERAQALNIDWVSARCGSPC